MKPYQSERPAVSFDSALPPTDELKIAVTFRAASDGVGLTKFAGRISADSVAQFRPDPKRVDEAIEALHRRGFVVTARGTIGITVRGARKLFETTFGTTLSPVKLDPTVDYSTHAFFFPAQGAPWKPEPALTTLIDDAYIQWPHIYMAGSKPNRAKLSAKGLSGRKTRAQSQAAPMSGALEATAPTVSDYYNLDVLKDVPRLLNVAPIHAAGRRGAGVRLAMVDTGFLHSHPFFVKNAFTSSIVLAPKATNRDTDPRSHGTGESANVFAVAPGVTFIGVKVENDADPREGASMLEGFLEARSHNPQIISLSMGYDLREPDEVSPMSTLPNNLKALEAEVQSAVADGVVVIFSAGNGHYSFPGQMPEVISAGGTYIDRTGAMQASDYASAFLSRIYSGRSVPDYCGLVGMLPHADYIMLPVPPGDDIDQDNAEHDGTAPDDGWAVFSGTSAAAPQLAGVVALLLEKNPGLTSTDIKQLLKRTARDVTTGHANPVSDPAGVGVTASVGDDGATGAGIIDAFAAWQQA
jgi:subtilisin family serine protease